MFYYITLFANYLRSKWKMGLGLWRLSLSGGDRKGLDTQTSRSDLFLSESDREVASMVVVWSSPLEFKLGRLEAGSCR